MCTIRYVQFKIHNFGSKNQNRLLYATLEEICSSFSLLHKFSDCICTYVMKYYTRRWSKTKVFSIYYYLLLINRPSISTNKFERQYLWNGLFEFEFTFNFYTTRFPLRVQFLSCTKGFAIITHGSREKPLIWVTDIDYLKIVIK